ncbi:MAG: hypothetical protein K0U84_01730 [Actinomycetia bacterium]|nr:hypothetical protein [Actinomycetes bacterium]
MNQGLGLEFQVREFARVNRELIAKRDQALAENARLTEQLATSTILREEQLETLPTYTILRYRFASRAGLNLHEIWEHLPGGWYCIGGATSPPMGDYGTPSLPARLIWHPDWECADAAEREQ